MDEMQFGKKKAKRGFAQLMAVALTFVLGVILIFNVVLPVLNTGITGTSANLTGYTGANGVASASYIISVLAVLALAAGVVLAFFRGTGGI